MEPRDERLEPLGGVGRLELCQLREELLRAAHLVDDAQLVEGLVVLLDLELAMTLSMSRVMRSSVGRPSVSIALASAAGALHERPSACDLGGPGSSSRSA
jgi:hypothetical protein